MKILQVIPSLNKGGAERICLDICNELIQQGHVVKLVTLSAKNAYSFLTDSLDCVIVSTNLKLSLYRKNLVDVESLQQLIDEFEPDVIHSHLFEAEINLAFCKIPKSCKRVIHFHDNMVQMQSWNWSNWNKKQAITNYYERYLILKKLTSNVEFLSISDDTSKFIEKHLKNRVKTTLLFNAINLERFNQFSKVKSSVPKLVNIGSFVIKKNQSLAIDTLKVLIDRGIDIQLFFLGDGVLKMDLVEKVKNLHLDPHVFFEGNVDLPEEYLSSSTIYLHTAIYEPFGLVLLEAMASGLPVVCTDGYGNRDLIIEGENGYLVFQRNAELLADKIQLLLEDEELRKQMGDKARKYAQQFGIDIYVEKLLKIYQFKV